MVLPALIFIGIEQPSLPGEQRFRFDCGSHLRTGANAVVVRCVVIALVGVLLATGLVNRLFGQACEAERIVPM